MTTPRTLIIHHDDLGGSHGANRAFVELWDLGLATCGSVMVPCPWFPEIARIARERPELDLGVHLTLTSEWDDIRWRPLTGVGGNGLCDADGFFWKRVKDARRADPKAVEAELRAQIETALAAGIDVTHLDSHMGTVWMPEFLDIFIRLGREYRVPIGLTRDLVRMGAEAIGVAAAYDELLPAGHPDLVSYVTTPFDQPVATEERYREMFNALLPGLNFGAFHFTAPGDMEFFAPDIKLRTTEYDLFRSGTAKRLLDEAGIALAGMRGYREQMRSMQ
jgi:chitin disaccharide deacetylase